MADSQDPSYGGSDAGKNVYFQKNIFIFSFPGTPANRRGQDDLNVQPRPRTVGGDNEVNS
jgi:hypothetical protein